MTVGDRFDSLSEASIDASSIIYLLKAGTLGLLGSTITLRSIPEVIAETGWPELPVVPEEPATGRSGGVAEDYPGGALSNDDLLLEFARRAGLPVISEDRALLRGAEEVGLDYYNALMMLAFLRYRNRLDEAWYEEAKARLLEVARYGDDVMLKFARIAEALDL